MHSDGRQITFVPIDFAHKNCTFSSFCIIKFSISILSVDWPRTVFTTSPRIYYMLTIDRLNSYERRTTFHWNYYYLCFNSSCNTKHYSFKNGVALRRNKIHRCIARPDSESARSLRSLLNRRFRTNVHVFSTSLFHTSSWCDPCRKICVRPVVFALLPHHDNINEVINNY